MLELTEKQRDFLEIIGKYRKERGESPTISELCKLSGYGVSTVQYYLAVLIKKGWLYRVAGRARGLILVSNKNES
jgi:SOS-response transcriptional repressor LexA